MDWLVKGWYQSKPPAWWLRGLSGLFASAVAIRRTAYRRGWKAAKRFPVPVVVVGNLTVGGTGKTPLVIALAALLKQHGFRPGIISRGYGVDVGRDPRCVQTAQAWCGDEPTLIARRTQCPVWIHPVRARALEALLAHEDCDVILSDDGLQHYALYRDLEIVVVDASRGLGNGCLLPAGPLREPAERLAEADFVVVNLGSGEDSAWQAPAAGYGMTLAGDEAVNLLTGEIRPLQQFINGMMHAIAGIGHPERFFASLRAKGLHVDCKAWPDHHDYVADDLPQGTVLMTEKDGIKCRKFGRDDLWEVPVRAVLPSDFERNFIESLVKVRRGQEVA
ncbi:MAG: hypothetical protein RIQ52_1091 [Pseudomonadota bacterium]